MIMSLPIILWINTLSVFVKLLKNTQKYKHMASIQNAVKQFTTKYMGDNGVSAVSAHEENGEQCIKVAVLNLEKYRAKFPKLFLGHRLVLVDFLVSK